VNKVKLTWINYFVG